MAPDTSYSVTQVAHALGVSPTTVRNWARDYDRFLSTDANPDPEHERLFDDSDLSVLRTVKVLRDQRHKHPVIVARLADGERLESPDATAPPPRAASGRIVEQPAGETVRAFETALERSQNLLQSLTERLIESEVARARAETELRLLRERMSPIGDREPPAPAADAPAAVDDAPAAPPLTLGDAIRGWWRGRKG